MTTVRLTSTATVVNGKKSVGSSKSDRAALASMLKAALLKK